MSSPRSAGVFRSCYSFDLLYGSSDFHDSVQSSDEVSHKCAGDHYSHRHCHGGHLVYCQVAFKDASRVVRTLNALSD